MFPSSLSKFLFDNQEEQKKRNSENFGGSLSSSSSYEIINSFTSNHVEQGQTPLLSDREAIKIKAQVSKSFLKLHFEF